MRAQLHRGGVKALRACYMLKSGIERAWTRVVDDPHVCDAAAAAASSCFRRQAATTPPPHTHTQRARACSPGDALPAEPAVVVAGEAASLCSSHYHDLLHLHFLTKTKNCCRGFHDVGAEQDHMGSPKASHSRRAGT